MTSQVTNVTADQLAASLFEIDAPRATASIGAYARELMDEKAADGIAIGLSGGIDSAVLTAIISKTVGPDVLHLYHLPTSTSDPVTRQLAQAMADWAGAKMEIQDIDNIVGQRERGNISVPSRNGMVWYRLYWRLTGESPYLTYLRAQSGNGRPHGWRKRFYKIVMRRTLGGFHAGHCSRREVLEEKAASNNWLVLGAANLSEALTGWFVPDGIDDLYYQPISALYKTQVRQMAAYLRIPEQIRQQEPSADMRRGLTDSVAFGLPHSALDLVLDHLEGGVTEAQLALVGITQDQIQYIRTVNQLSEWRRSAEHAPPPVDGRVIGGLRTAHPPALPANPAMVKMAG